MWKKICPARLFNLNTQLKNIFLKTLFEDIRTKEQKSFSAIEICTSLVKLRDNV